MISAVTIALGLAALALLVTLAIGLVVFFLREKVAVNERRATEIETAMRAVELSLTRQETQMPNLLELLRELKGEVANTPTREEFTRLMASMDGLRSEVTNLTRQLGRLEGPIVDGARRPA